MWAVRLRKRHGFEKLFALKTLLSSGEEGQQRRLMFLDEARLASRVSHPNVCEVVDFGDEAGLLYMVLEWVDGESLYTVLNAAAAQDLDLPVDVAVRIVSDAARGLHSAHELKAEDGSPLGIVHRDVSLQNVLVRRDGVAKVIDFGVATYASQMNATASGVLKGKLRYLAPEQIAGASVDRRADVRALGIVLLTTLTGRRPYDGLSGTDVLRAIADEQSPGNLDDPRIDPRLRQVLARAIAPLPSHRFSTAAELADALDRAIPESTSALSRVASFAGAVCQRQHARRTQQLLEARARVDVLGPASASLEATLAELTGPKEVSIPIEVTLSGLEARPAAVDGEASSYAEAKPTVRLPPSGKYPTHPTPTGFSLDQTAVGQMRERTTTAPATATIRVREDRPSSLKRNALLGAVGGIAIGLGVAAAMLRAAGPKAAAADSSADVSSILVPAAVSTAVVIPEPAPLTDGDASTPNPLGSSSASAAPPAPRRKTYAPRKAKPDDRAPRPEDMAAPPSRN